MNAPRPVCSTIALCGALGSLGYTGIAIAVPIPPDNCNPQAGFQTSQVLDAVNADTPVVGRFEYGFRVCNTSQGLDNEEIRDWELPWFGDDTTNISDIQNIVTPESWSWSIETIGVNNPGTGWEGVADWQTPGDPFYHFFNEFFSGDPNDTSNNPYLDVTHVLHFYTDVFFEAEFGFGDPIAPGNSRTGFGFDSSFDSTNAPYQASWINLPVRTGDPQFPLGGQPNNPILQAAVPEPGTLAMLGLGLGALAARRRRRRDDD